MDRSWPASRRRLCCGLRRRRVCRIGDAERDRQSRYMGKEHTVATGRKVMVTIGCREIAVRCRLVVSVMRMLALMTRLVLTRVLAVMAGRILRRMGAVASGVVRHGSGHGGGVEELLGLADQRTDKHHQHGKQGHAT